jgi:hypothetical protein
MIWFTFTQYRAWQIFSSQLELFVWIGTSRIWPVDWNPPVRLRSRCVAGSTPSILAMKSEEGPLPYCRTGAKSESFNRPGSLVSYSRHIAILRKRALCQEEVLCTSLHGLPVAQFPVTLCSRTIINAQRGVTPNSTFHQETSVRTAGRLVASRTISVKFVQKKHFTLSYTKSITYNAVYTWNSFMSM